MNNVTDEQSGHTNTETFIAIQSVQYLHRAEKKASLKMFARRSRLHDSINTTLCNNFFSTSRKYLPHLNEERIENLERKRHQMYCKELKSVRKSKTYRKNQKKKGKI